MPLGPLVDGVRYTKADAVRGICQGFRERGFKIYVAPDVDILHPHVDDPYDVWKPDQKQKGLGASDE